MIRRFCEPCSPLAQSGYIRVSESSRDFWALLIAKAIILAHAPWVTRGEGKGGNWHWGWRHIVVRVHCLGFPRTAACDFT